MLGQEDVRYRLSTDIYVYFGSNSYTFPLCLEQRLEGRQERLSFRLIVKLASLFFSFTVNNVERRQEKLNQPQQLYKQLHYTIFMSWLTLVRRKKKKFTAVLEALDIFSLCFMTNVGEPRENKSLTPTLRRVDKVVFFVPIYAEFL